MDGRMELMKRLPGPASQPQELRCRHLLHDAVSIFVALTQLYLVLASICGSTQLYLQVLESFTCGSTLLL